MPLRRQIRARHCLRRLRGARFKARGIVEVDCRGESYGRAYHSGALFIDLLHSDSVDWSLWSIAFNCSMFIASVIESTLPKRLVSRTRRFRRIRRAVSLPLSVKDEDPVRRARHGAGLPRSTECDRESAPALSSAHQERTFIEARLADVKSQLERAKEALSEFSSKNSTIDLPEPGEGYRRIRGEDTGDEGRGPGRIGFSAADVRRWQYTRA